MRPKASPSNQPGSRRLLGSRASGSKGLGLWVWGFRGFGGAGWGLGFKGFGFGEALGGR